MDPPTHAPRQTVLPPTLAGVDCVSLVTEGANTVRLITTALTLMLVTSLVAPTPAEASWPRAPSTVERDGVAFTTRARVTGRESLHNLRVVYEYGIRLKYWKKRVRLEEVRVALWQARRGQPHLRMVVTTFTKRVRSPFRGKPLVFRQTRWAFEGTHIDPGCEDPLGERFYTIARIKEVGKRPVFLDSRDLQVSTHRACER